MANSNGETIDGEVSLTPFETMSVAITTYLVRTGWVKTERKTHNGWEIWIDGHTLYYCTKAAALNNQLVRDGFFAPSNRHNSFGTGLANNMRATREAYEALRGS